ncbi:MAG: alpha-galactosidase [Clostridia bacterium]|nr:alpha-galactosidase [Clostridia bacterium]
MDIKFGSFQFNVNENGDVALVKYCSVDNSDLVNFYADYKNPVYQLLEDEAYGVSDFVMSESTRRLKYVSHEINGNLLTIVQENGSSRITSIYEKYEDTNAIRITQKITNISDVDVDVLMLNTCCFRFGRNVMAEQKDWYLHRFSNSRYTESMPLVSTFFDLGVMYKNGAYRYANVSNHSSIEYVPQLIVENRKTSDFMMFQLESYWDWYTELTTDGGRMFALELGGANAMHHAWDKVLAPGESYESVPVSVCFGKSVNEVAKEMTFYRRHLRPDAEVDKNLPAIYNEYMHYSWDSPFEKRALETAPAVAKAGVEYYIIDCGWHNSPDANSTNSMYRLFGTWREDRGRFPNGIKYVSDYMHSLGMKFGLWIAPEVVGMDNKEMLEYYGDECFMQIKGKKICNGTGYLLDYRHEKVRDYMSKTIRRMIEEYGCDYIKFDGCPASHFGTDYNSTSMGAGLDEHTKAFNDWSQEMINTFPNVIFEDCAGGGQRTDYKALSMFHLISTSDQTDYDLYPYITGNIFMSVLPEQAAVWSYPIDRYLQKEYGFEDAAKHVSDERVAVNMINAVLGRIHFASPVQQLSEDKMALVREGVDFYKKIVPEKLQAVPYWPNGYNLVGDTSVSVGLKTDNKIYLAVWNLRGDKTVTVPLADVKAKNVVVAYPKSLATDFSFDENSITVNFTEDVQARIFEITL